MASFNKRHMATKIQCQEKAARRRNRPGGIQQRKGIHPYDHRLPKNPVYIQPERHVAKGVK